MGERRYVKLNTITTTYCFRDEEISRPFSPPEKQRRGRDSWTRRMSLSYHLQQIRGALAPTRLPTSSYPPILASTPCTPPDPAPAVFGRALGRDCCPFSFQRSSLPPPPSPLGPLPSLSPRAPRGFGRELGPEDNGLLCWEPFQMPPVVCGLTPDLPAPPPPPPPPLP